MSEIIIYERQGLLLYQNLDIEKRHLLLFCKHLHLTHDILVG